MNSPVFRIGHPFFKSCFWLFPVLCVAAPRNLIQVRRIMRMTPSKPNIDSLFPLFYVLRPRGSIIENNRLWLFLLLSFLDILFLWQPSKEKVPKRKISASDASAKIYGIFNPRRPSRTDVQIGKCSIFDNQFSIFHFSLFTFHLNRRSIKGG